MFKGKHVSGRFRFRLQRQGGFTLLEIILTIVVGVIMAGMLVTFTGTMVSRSTQPAANFNRMLELHQTMENMSADYVNILQRNNLIADLQSRLGSQGNTYDNAYGNYRVVEIAEIDFTDGDGDGIYDEITSSGSDLLKVTIESVGQDPKFRFTTIFSDPKP